MIGVKSAVNTELNEIIARIQSNQIVLPYYSREKAQSIANSIAEVLLLATCLWYAHCYSLMREWCKSLEVCEAKYAAARELAMTEDDSVQIERFKMLDCYFSDTVAYANQVYKIQQTRTKH